MTIEERTKEIAEEWARKNCKIAEEDIYDMSVSLFTHGSSWMFSEMYMLVEALERIASAMPDDTTYLELTSIAKKTISKFRYSE